MCYFRSTLFCSISGPPYSALFQVHLILFNFRSTLFCSISGPPYSVQFQVHLILVYFRSTLFCSISGPPYSIQLTTPSDYVYIHKVPIHNLDKYPYSDALYEVKIKADDNDIGNAVIFASVSSMPEHSMIKWQEQRVGCYTQYILFHLEISISLYTVR